MTSSIASETRCLDSIFFHFSPFLSINPPKPLLRHIYLSHRLVERRVFYSFPVLLIILDYTRLYFWLNLSPVLQRGQSTKIPFWQVYSEGNCRWELDNAITLSATPLTGDCFGGML
jgi:hypothetical protein